MGSATDGGLAPRAALRPVGLIAAIAVMQVLTFAMADYSAAGGHGAAVPWLLLDFFLVWRIWRGGYTAWCVLVTLNVGVIALATMTFFVHNAYMDGGPLLLVRVGVELALLGAPATRRWVAQN